MKTKAATTLLYGQPLVDALLPQAKIIANGLPQQPHVAIVLVGNDAPSHMYVQRKAAMAAQAGCKATIHALPSHTTQEQLHALLDTLNADSHTHGVMIQLPLPHGLNRQLALAHVAGHKDVDGLSPVQRAKLERQADDALLPATPLGVLRLLAMAGVELEGAHITILGTSALVGGPLADLLRQQGALVTSCNQQTADNQAKAAKANILITATGQAGLVTKSWVKQGAVVVDVGITRLPDGRIVGDVDATSAEGSVLGKARLLTPVPKGVGPCTVVSLITNLIDATCLQHGVARPVWRMLI
ncbi:MAG: bifunctional 5,10-methylenetetrahydrofolate dehydrogenase/5,10-methenyltetrahydrofolate cyclohydrolase [Alphaproteobacteria bacterium]